MELLFSNGNMVYTGTDFSGIYAIQNHIDGKWYVGESIHVLNRILVYFYPKPQCKSQKLIYNAIKKYGKENFSCYKLEECSLEQLYDREVHWGKQLNSLKPNGYNFKLGGERKVITVCNHTVESKKKISEASKGNKHNIGKKHTIETRMKVSIAGKGRKDNDEVKKKKSIARIGMKFSEEHRKNISIAKKGIQKKPFSDSHRENISKARIGMKLTPEHIKNIAMANRLTYTIKWLEKEAPWFCETT